MRDIRRFYINGKNPYKSPTTLINCHHPDISAVAEYLVKDATNNSEKIRVLLKFVQHDISYSLTAESFSWPASKVLYHKKGDFSQRLHLACALLRATDIGCRIHYYEAVHPLFERLEIYPSVALSGYLEIYDNKIWVATDRFLLPEKVNSDLLSKSLSLHTYSGQSELIWSTLGNHQVRNFGVLSDVLEVKNKLSAEVFLANLPGWWQRRLLNQSYQKYVESLNSGL
jgi:hypothetical protein